MAWEVSVAENPRWRDAQADEAFWASRARSYDERSPLASCATELVADLRSLLSPGGTLLEIGAGTGAFTRQLAPNLSEVTCVEPSSAMRRAFASAWNHPLHVRSIASDWLTAPENLAADLVLCVNALYRTADIATALEKMTRAARGHVAIAQSVGRPHARPLKFYEAGRLWERERADALGHVLDALGLAYRREDYDVMRPDGGSVVALLVWRGSNPTSSPAPRCRSAHT
ncbi:MAG: class I SAM-dependent methyltransferase [Pseudomonadota bacterium]